MESHLFGNLRKWEAGKRDSGAINIAQMHLQMGHKSELIILILCYHIIYFIWEKMALYCPQGSGKLRQQLLMMHGIALYCMVLHVIV